MAALCQNKVFLFLLKLKVKISFQSAVRSVLPPKTALWNRFNKLLTELGEGMEEGGGPQGHQDVRDSLSLTHMTDTKDLMLP